MESDKTFARLVCLAILVWLSICVSTLALGANAAVTTYWSPSKRLDCDQMHCTQVSLKASKLPALVPISPLTYRPVLDLAQYALHQGDARSANLIEGIVPLYQSSSHGVLSFADIRFYNPNGTPMEGNIDVGLRTLFDQHYSLFGLYAGYDRYRSQTRRYYSQVNAGLECWIHRFFMGANAYVPVGTKVYDYDPLNLAYLTPTTGAASSYRYNIAYEAGKERAMPGGDAEVGYDFSHGLTVYAGGYYFDHANAKRIAGPKLRTTYTFYRSSAHRLLYLFDRIRFEGLISHDSVRGTRWLAGIRFSFGLSKHPNPSTGLARHMTDPIRRDLNVISEEFNAPAQFYKIDGRRARVDIVSNNSGRSINEAIDGTDANADIIGVVDDREATSSLPLGDRPLTITGGSYEFSVNGHPYVVNNVGFNGSVTANAGANTFNLVPDAMTVTLEHLGILTNIADTDTFALTNNNTGTYGSFDQLTLDDVTSNGVILLKLDGAETGQLTFVNNTIDLSSSSQAKDTLLDELAAVLLYVTDSSAKIRVNQFSNNHISVAGRTADSYAKVSSVRIIGDSNSPIIFKGNFSGNIIGIYDNTGSTGYGGMRVDNGYFLRSIIDNQFISTGNTATSASIPLTFDGDKNEVRGHITKNTFLQTGPASGFGRGMAIAGPLTIKGDIYANTFSVSGNAGFPGVANSVGLLVSSNLGGSVDICGIYNNVFILNDNQDSSYGIRLLGTDNPDAMLINMNIFDNKITIDTDEGPAFGMSIDDHIKVLGSIKRNTIQINNASPSANSGFIINEGDRETAIFQQAVSDNVVTIESSGSENVGFRFITSGSGEIRFNYYNTRAALENDNPNAGIFDFGSANVIPIT